MNFIVSILASRFFPYILAGLLAFGVVTTIYMKGKSDARNEALIEQLQENNRVLLADIARKKKASEDDQKSAADDANKIADLEARTKDLLNELKNADAVCLDAGDTDSLLKLWADKPSKSLPRSR